MTLLGMSARRGERSRELARSPSRRIGGACEFSTFALLVLCFAVAVGIVVQRGHREVNGAGPPPAASVHQATVPNPRSYAPVSSSDDDAAWIAAAAGNLGNAAVDTIHTAVKIVWDLALWVSNRIIGYVADSWVNPVTGDRLIFNAAPGAFNLAVAILALAMVAVVMMALASPVYATWKSWRLSRAHLVRYRSH
jgi:hypothetical protein